MSHETRQNANIIAKPTAIPGFLIGDEKDPYYTLKRQFKKNSSLKKYLSEKFPEQITESKQNYTLYEILDLIEKIVGKEKLYDKNNPGLIIGNKDFADGLNTSLILTSEVHMVTITHLHLTEKSKKKLKRDEPKVKPHSTEHDWVYLPKWASDEATAVKAAKATRMAVEECRLWEVKPGLRAFMNAQDNYNKCLFKFDDIMRTITKTIHEDKYTKCDEYIHTTMKITKNLLKNALEVTAFDLTQLASLVQYQLVRNTQELPPDIQAAVDKAMEILSRSNDRPDAKFTNGMFIKTFNF